MSTFKTLAEIQAANEIIQYLEEITSGSLVSSSGINRAIERLSTNTNALMEALQTTKLPTTVSGGGTIGYAGGNASWSSTINVIVASELHGTQYNTIAAGSFALPSGSVLYVVLNRASAAALTPTVATLNNYLTLAAPAGVKGEANRLDYVILAVATSDGVIWQNGTRVRIDQTLTDFFIDSQYGQQSELTTVHTNQKQNVNLHLQGGGDITWARTGNRFQWSSALTMEIFEGSSINGTNSVGSADQVIPPDNCWWWSLNRNPAGATVTPTTGVSPFSTFTADDDRIIIAMHNSTDNRLYLCDGTVLDDGDLTQLGGSRTGVQWITKGTGASLVNSDTGLTDFTLAVTAASYKIGSGELMVYRNGVKASRSTTGYWLGSPPAGALIGSITAYDEYVEVKSTLGAESSSKIIWAKDPSANPSASGPLVQHALDHDPYIEYPSATDIVEAFVGVQGNAPSLQLPDGVYGFEVITTKSDATTIYAGGGSIVTGGVKYVNSDTTPVSVTAASSYLINSETKPTVAGSYWQYIYIGPPSPATPGTSPRMSLSTTAPTTPFGEHPTENDWRFLTSCELIVSGGPAYVFGPLAKSGSRVTLGYTRVVNWPAPGAAIQYIDMKALSRLPDSARGTVRLRITATASSGASGDRYSIQVVPYVGAAYAVQTLYATRPNGTAEVVFEFEMPLTADKQIGALISSGNFSGQVVHLLGYSEGRASTGNVGG